MHCFCQWVSNMSLEQLSEQDRITWLEYISHLNDLDQQINKINPLKFSKQSSTRLDLHGLTIQQAHERCRVFVMDHWMAKTEKVTVITGKSGGIAHEFTSWCRNWSKWVHHYEPLVDSRSQVGSYRIWLKK